MTNRILVVEDDPDVREILAEVLTGSGYVVGTARHGQEALQWLRASEPPALIVLDLMMPVMNGHELLAHLRQHPALRHIPVVVMSAAANQFADLDGATATVLLHKPVRMSTLLDAIERICAALVQRVELAEGSGGVASDLPLLQPRVAAGSVK